MILVNAAGGVDGQLQALVADLAGGADGLGLGRLGLLPGLGEEPLGIAVAAGGLVQPPLPAVVLDHHRPLPPHPALPDPDQAGDVSEGEALATLDLPQPPQLLDPL